MALLRKQSKVSGAIPTSSMADIAFLLLIFFLVTTQFPQDRKRDVVTPEAATTVQLDEKRQNVLHLWIDADGSVFINDAPVVMARVSEVVAPVYEQSEGELVVAIRSDRAVPYAVIDGVTEELREAGALRVNFATSVERGAVERR